MKKSFLKTFIIGSVILFFSLGGLVSFQMSSGKIEVISLNHTAFASGGYSSGGHSSGGRTYSQTTNSNSSISTNASSSIATQNYTDTEAPQIFIHYPTTDSYYEFESETGEFTLIGLVTDNKDSAPKLQISYEGETYTQFQSFMAPEGVSQLTIIAEDSSGNSSKKVLAIKRTKPVFQNILETTLNNEAVLDSDGDGLSDDFERKIGTHTMKKDSDSDGVSDFKEIQNFSNPLGKGKAFTDLQKARKDLVSQDALRFLIENGALRLNSKGLFYPQNSINRAEAIKLITNVTQQENTDDLSPLSFQDVSPDDWFYKNVQQAVQAGIINTNQSEFHGYKKLNRAEAMKMIFTAFDFPIGHIPPEEISYSDVDIVEWYSPYVAFAVENELLPNNWNPSFFPGREISRGEFSDILYKTAELSKSGDFKMFQAMPEAEWMALIEKKNESLVVQAKSTTTQTNYQKTTTTPPPLKSYVSTNKNTSNSSQQSNTSQATAQQAAAQAAQQKAAQDAAAKKAAQQAAQEAAIRAAKEAAARLAAQQKAATQPVHTQTRTS